MTAVNGAVLILAASLALAVWFALRIRKVSRDIDQRVESVANLRRALPEQQCTGYRFRCVSCKQPAEAQGLAEMMVAVRANLCVACIEAGRS